MIPRYTPQTSNQSNHFYGREDAAHQSGRAKAGRLYQYNGNLISSKFRFGGGCRAFTWVWRCSWVRPDFQPILGCWLRVIAISSRTGKRSPNPVTRRRKGPSFLTGWGWVFRPDHRRIYWSRHPRLRSSSESPGLSTSFCHP